jgi:hypothetical protein
MFGALCGGAPNWPGRRWLRLHELASVKFVQPLISFTAAGVRTGIEHFDMDQIRTAPAR